jgi:ubiquinol-cytochrome c reductase cytochrome b subunit
LTGKPGRASRLGSWFDQRTGAARLLHESLDEPIPGGPRFAYVFGSALLFLFVSQVITGLCLALYYVPSPDTAHVTVAYIIKEVAGGAFIRSLHSYGSSAMIVVLVLHFLQTFLYGSFKGRRELLWIAGCVLALLILGMTFTGYLLRWDLKAYFAGAVGTNLVGDVPLIGGWLRRLVRGGDSMGALTLSRFYVLHLFIIPAMIFAFIAAHVWLFRKAGAAGPMAEDPVQPRLPTRSFYPGQVIIDMAFVLLAMGVLGTLAHFVPVELGPAANPSSSTYLPRPEWYYLPFFQWLKFWEGGKTVIGVVLIPALLIGLVFALPFLDRGLERRPWKRPIPVAAVLIVLLGLVGLGMQSRLDDSRDPTTASQIAQQDLAEGQYFRAPFQPQSAPGGAAPAPLSAEAAQGKGLFESHGCSGCHGLAGAGGKGPALTHISDQLQPAPLAAILTAPTAQMKAGGMVSLTLSAAEMTGLVAYLDSLGGGASIGAAAPGSPPSASAPAPATGQPAAAPPTAAASSAAAAPGKKAASGSAAKPATAAKSSDKGGEATFNARGCTACHGAGGVGTSRGPALTKVAKTLSPAALTALLENPNQKMTAGGMPATSLPAPEMKALVAYIEQLGGAAAAPAAAGGHAKGAPAAQPESPAPARPMSSAETSGQKIFEAHRCRDCHGVKGEGGTAAAPPLAGAATLAPALVSSMLLHPTAPMHKGGMPEISLSESELRDLAAYVSSLGSK